MENLFINPEREQWKGIIKRPAFDYAILERIVHPILEDVKTNGDVALQKYSAQFDGVHLEDFKVTAAEIKNAVIVVNEELKNAIGLAIKNITTFHTAHTEPLVKIETTPGVMCWRKPVAIESVGLYIPGGTAPLFSTLLMLAIPAQIAGCKNIIVCTPCDKNGNVHPSILCTANILGINNIYKIGGAQAVAAMAYGTESVPRVYKIFGPGNQYVTSAKQLVSRQGIAIDMPAGPSEVAIYADDTAVPSFIASDLLSQAEHGVDSQVVLVASSKKIVEEVQQQVSIQLAVLPRKAIAEKALIHSRWVVMQDVNNAFDFLNAYAAEHLIIASEQAVQMTEKVINAGSVFLGNYSPESAGDYASGPNHTLPTNGYATAYSGVSVDSFVKKITFQQLSKEGLQNIGTAVQTMAAAEGLAAHKNAVTIRLKT